MRDGPARLPSGERIDCLKKLDQYLIREMIVPFLTGTLVVVLMFHANTYIYLAKTFNLDNVPAKAIVQYLYYQTPQVLNMTLAVGITLGSSLAMSRIARESELTAIRAAGVRIFRTIMPVIAFGTLVGLGNLYLAEKVMPGSTKRALEVQTQIIGATGAATIKSNAIVPLQNRTLFVGSLSKRGTEDLDLERVMMLASDGAFQELYMAPKGKYKDGIWTFESPRVFRWRPKREEVGIKEETFQPVDAEKMTVHERIFTDGLFQLPNFEEQTAEQLRSQIALGKINAMDVKPLEVEFHSRFAVPAACIVFAIVGPVFAIFFARTGGFIGVFLSIVLVMLYYNAFVISTEILSKVEMMPAWAAAWTPNILFAILGGFAVRRLE